MAAVPLATWAMWAAVGSTAVTAVAAVRSSQANAAAANYNAQIASQNAQTAEAQGAAAAEAQARDSQRRIGAAVATYGASGVDGGIGSPADVLADSSRQSALDNLTLKYNYKLRGLGYSNQAELDRSNASNASSAGYLSAAGALMGGAASSYYRSQGGGGTGIPTTG